MDATIIIPVYNAEKFLDQCLTSVINQQTKYQYEIITVNDGSTDNSLNILKKYQDRIRIINKENTGPGDSRNHAIKQATGQYLLFVDSDDYVREDFVEKMLSTIITKKTDIVICDMYRVDSQNNLELISKGQEKAYQKGLINEVLMMEFHSCNKIFKKDLMIKHLYPSDMFFEDVVAVSENEIAANSIYKICEPLYYYRRTNESTTNTIQGKNYDILKATEMIEKKFLENGYQKEIEFLFVNNILVDLIAKIFKANKENKMTEIKNLKQIVDKKYPNWSKNYYLKNVRVMKKIYLFLLKHKFYFIIDIIM